MWVYLANLGLSGMAMDAEYTMTMPHISRAMTTHAKGWSNPRVCGTSVVAAKEPRPTRRTGNGAGLAAAAAERRENQPDSV